MSREDRKAMIAAARPGLSLSRQCQLLSISRSSFYDTPHGESAENLALMRRIDELFLRYPFYGSRQMVRQLRRDGVSVGRHRIRRLMRLMGLETIYRAPKTSVRHPEHRIYPYLLRNLVIDRPDRVWCADVTYISVQRGFLPGRDHGLGEPSRACMASFQHHGRRFLLRGAEGGDGGVRQARDLQYRPGQPGRIQAVVATP